MFGFFFWPQNMWDLTSQTRDRTCTPLEGEVLVIRPPGRSQGINFRLDIQRSFCGYTISAEPAKWIMQSQPPTEKQSTNKGLQRIQLFRYLIAREKNKMLIAQSGTTLCNPMAVAHQAPLSMGFSRQEYWRGLPFPSLGDLPNPGIEPWSPVLAGRFFTI